MVRNFCKEEIVYDTSKNAPSQQNTRNLTHKGHRTTIPTAPTARLTDTDKTAKE